MKIKQKIKNIGHIGQVIKDTGKSFLYSLPFVLLPVVLEAKPLDLQQVQEDVAMKYLNGAEMKVDKNGHNFYAGMISDIDNGNHINFGVRNANGNTSWNAAVLGKKLGIEAEGNFKKNSLTLDLMVKGNGLGVTGTYDGQDADITGNIFRAEQVGNATFYGKIQGNKDNVDVSGLGFYIGPTIGKTTVIPLAFGSKSLTSDNYYFMTGAVFASGKVSACITTGTSDLREWTPSVKIKYKF